MHSWWNAAHIGAAVSEGLVVVAEAEGEIVGVGQRGRRRNDHVVYKLYVDPRYRGGGLGPRLLTALVRHLPPGTERLYIEHFAANERAGSFYEREGFMVERIERDPAGDPVRDVVWRARDLRQDAGSPRDS